MSTLPADVLGAMFNRSFSHVVDNTQPNAISTKVPCHIDRSDAQNFIVCINGPVLTGKALSNETHRMNTHMRYENQLVGFSNQLFQCGISWLIF